MERTNKKVRAGFFSDPIAADQAVRDLLAAGFTKDQLAIICPEQLACLVAPGVPRAELPGSHGARDVAAGAVVGATLGGLALAARGRPGRHRRDAHLLCDQLDRRGTLAGRSIPSVLHSAGPLSHGLAAETSRVLLA